MGADDRRAGTEAEADGERRSRRWLGRLLLGAAAAMLALMSAGAAYQWIARAQDERAFPPPGRLIDVGGHRLHLHCLGEGRPTVILESGAAAMSSAWIWVQRGVAGTSRVCAYDRAGLGWSEPGPAPRDARRVARELHALLEGAGERGPYVLVGHSMGGLFVRAYAGLYPDEVAGLVLVDPAHPDQLDRLPEQSARTQRLLLGLLSYAPVFAPFGVVRVVQRLAGMDEGLPPRQRAEMQAFRARSGHLTAAYAEIAAWPRSVAQIRAAAGDVGDRPLVVLSATAGEPDFVRAWHALHRELAELSTEGGHRLVRGANHLSILMQRDHAREVADAVRGVVAAAREERAAGSR